MMSSKRRQRRPTPARATNVRAATEQRSVRRAVTKALTWCVQSLAQLIRGFVVPFLVAIALVAALAYFVLPTPTWRSQREDADRGRARLAHLVEMHTELREAIALLRTDEEIERLARRDFNLIYPGEQAYIVLPEGPASDVDQAAPGSVLDEDS